jgi:hypothetical protein
VVIQLRSGSIARRAAACVELLRPLALLSGAKPELRRRERWWLPNAECLRRSAPPSAQAEASEHRREAERQRATEERSVFRVGSHQALALRRQQRFALLLPQRDHRIHARRTPRRHYVRHERNNRQHPERQRKAHRVERLYE